MKLLQVAIPIAAGLVAAAALAAWLMTPPPALEIRLPGAEANIPRAAMGDVIFTPGRGSPSKIAGAWPCFRGSARDNVALDSAPLAKPWPAAGPTPRPLWTAQVGDGYASPAVWNGRAFLLDYDIAAKSDTLRCLSLDTGEEIWRRSYRVEVLRNHGMSRAMPAVSDEAIVSIGPKCHVLALDPLRGNVRWTIDLVKDYGTRVPDWYSGQCPLIDGNKAIIAPGGKSLIIAVDCLTGRVIWQTPNPRGWAMSHSSVAPMDLAGRRTYVYCANEGTVGVDAETGKLLWETEAAAGAPTYWRITPTVVPSPIILPEGRIFLSGGYGAGSLMIQIAKDGDEFKPKALFRLKPEVFGAEQQTPIFFQGHIYGIRAKPADELVCLDLEGKVLWTSAPKRFGLGPLLIVSGAGRSTATGGNGNASVQNGAASGNTGASYAQGGPDGSGSSGGVIYAMNDSGLLTLIRAAPDKYEQLAEAKVLDSDESWGPIIPFAGRLIVRDLNKMTCLEVGNK